MVGHFANSSAVRRAKDDPPLHWTAAANDLL
jgi:hypothetical protein